MNTIILCRHERIYVCQGTAVSADTLVWTINIITLNLCIMMAVGLSDMISV